MWSSNLLEKLCLVKNEYDSEIQGEFSCQYGPSVWSADYFIFPEKKTLNDESQISTESQPSELICDNDETHNEIFSDESIIDKVRRSSRVPKFNISEIIEELSRSSLHLHSLIAPINYSQLEEKQHQPFELCVHPQVPFLCDLHSHLCSAEVIGLLAGKWDAVKNILYIQAPFPCAGTQRINSGATDVELDPVSEYEVREVIENLGLRVVGWYHSHPKFKPHPSITDIINQRQYQNLMRDETTGQEPFAGLIVSTYDTKLTSIVSHHQWFHVNEMVDQKSASKVKADIPMALEASVLTLKDDSFSPWLTNVKSEIIDEFLKTIRNPQNDIMPDYVNDQLYEINDIETNLNDSIVIEDSNNTINNSLHNNSITHNIDSAGNNNQPSSQKLTAEEEFEKLRKDTIDSLYFEKEQSLRPSRNIKKREFYDDGHFENIKKEIRMKKREDEQKKQILKEEENLKRELLEKQKKIELKQLKKIKKNSSNDFGPTNDLNLTLTCFLSEDSNECSILCREIILKSNPQVLSLLLSSISLVIYYRYYDRKVNLNAKWKGITYLEKIKGSLNIWGNSFNTDIFDAGIMVDSIIFFLSKLWETRP